MKNPVILLATDDPAVTDALQATDCRLNCVKTWREAVSMVMDGDLTRQDVAIVDMDWQEGARAMLHTVCGALPVIAISAKPCAWLTSMLEHHRLGAALTKPLSADALRSALEACHSA